MTQSIQKTGQAVTLAQFMEQRKGELAKALPKHLSVDRMIKVAVNSVSKNPALKECGMLSVLQCVATCAELGLEPGGALGGAYLVPYGKVCTLIVGYRGFVDLMRRSGLVTTVRAVAVHAKDLFRYREGLEVVLEHEPCLDVDPGPMVRVYCVLALRDGGSQVTVMSRAQVDAIRDRSRSAKSGPWVSDYEEMAKKTVVRRAAKLAPMSADLAEALEREDGDFIDGEVVGQSAAVLDGPSAAEVALKKKAAKLQIKDVPTPPPPVTSTGEPPPDVALPGDEPPPMSDADFRGQS